MANAYSKKFFRLLSEDLGIDPDAEKAALGASLDDGTDPSAFETDQNVQDVNASVEKAMSDREQMMTQKLQEWIDEMEQFRELLNGQNEQSIQHTLATAEPETILDKMKNAEQRKIARVATEIAALIESFKGYIAQSGNSNLKYV